MVTAQTIHVQTSINEKAIDKHSWLLKSTIYNHSAHSHISGYHSPTKATNCK